MTPSLPGLVLGLSASILSSACATAASPAKARPGGEQPATEVLFVRAERLIVRPGVELEGAQVVVRDGRIAAVGKDLAVPEGARELAAPYVCAAYLDPWGALGLAADARVDSATTAGTRAADGVDTYGNKELRLETLRAGVTCVRVQAGASARVSGLGAVLRVAPGLSPAEAILAAESALAMSVGLSANAPNQGPSFDFVDGQLVQRESSARGMDLFDRVGDIDRVVTAIEGGRSYLQSKIEHKHELAEWQKKITEKETELDKEFKKAKKDREKEEKDAKEKGKKFEEKKYKEDKRPQPPRYDEDNEVLGRVANGELPLVVQVHRTAELRGLLAATAKHDRLRLLVAGGSEAMNCSATLVERGVPVIVMPALVGEGAVDELDGADLTLAARLAKAGVEVLIGSGGGSAAASRDLPLLAQIAVGNGWTREAAFAALTVGAARALDVERSIGTVERGKSAELLLLEGEPLTNAGRVKYVISAGRVVLTPETK